MSMREFLNSPSGQKLSFAIVGLGLIVVAAVLWRSVSTPEAVADSYTRTYICAETGKPFQYTLSIGEKNPVPSPHSGKSTGYPAEKCFWTREGGTQQEPTLVLLNSFLGKPEPTFCPDCGRLVVGLNPPADSSAKPPPTEQEHKARRNTGPSQLDR